MAPRAGSSFYTVTSDDDDHEEFHTPMARRSQTEQPSTAGASSHRSRTAQSSPTASRKLRSTRTSDLDLHMRIPRRSHEQLDEHSSLLQHADERGGSTGYDGTSTGYGTAAKNHQSIPSTPHRRHVSRSASFRLGRGFPRTQSFTSRLAAALHGESSMHEAMTESRQVDDRGWYDQFTSTDWVHDSIADAYRIKALRSRRDFRGRLYAFFDGAQGWILVAIIGFLVSCMATCVTVTETVLFDWKGGHCLRERGWHFSRKRCCDGGTICDNWVPWSDTFKHPRLNATTVEYIVYIGWVIALASLSCLLTLITRTVISSTVSLSTLDENLGADNLKKKVSSDDDDDDDESVTQAKNANHHMTVEPRPPVVYYSAAGSGVAEVRVILSGFVLHGYLGVRTLILKTAALILSVASGLSLGKEGPYVHIATCIGNVATRLFPKYSHNDAKRREVLSASAAAGVAVAFGAPIGGVLFSLEEVSYYFPPKTLFRTFFCCIVAALSTKFLDPYGTRKIVLFEVRYLTDWHGFEMVAFIIIGVLGGLIGALFIKASRFWAKTFRRIPAIKRYPLLETFLVALVTGLVSFWNRYTNLPVAELLFELASPCDMYTETGDDLCPVRERIPSVIFYLAIAFVIKLLLTIVTFGIKVPAGIYVPSMVVGGLLGRMIGHTVQYLALTYSHTGLFGNCSPSNAPEQCVVPGVYALVAAGATMCGVTRLSVTLAVILFELTGSLDHVMPFSIGVLVSKWTADAIEPLSIYDLLTDMNSYPFLDSKVRPIFTNELGDLLPSRHRSLRSERIIDISQSPLILASDLRHKVQYLHLAGELDGGLPILRDATLVGLIPAPDLEFALDNLGSAESSTMCLMESPGRRWSEVDPLLGSGSDDDEDEDNEREHSGQMRDFTPYIDPAPVSLDIHSPMDLVYECFVKLGLRYICVLRDGRYAGLIHKKTFVKHCKQVSEDGRNVSH